jgi:hypothetical protein
MALTIGEIASLVGIAAAAVGLAAGYIGRDRVIVQRIVQVREDLKTEINAVEKTMMVGMASVEKANLAAVEAAKEGTAQTVNILHERIGKLRTDTQADANDIRAAHVRRDDMVTYLAPLAEAHRRIQDNLDTLISETKEMGKQLAALVGKNGHNGKNGNGS